MLLVFVVVAVVVSNLKVYVLQDSLVGMVKGNYFIWYHGGNIRGSNVFLSPDNIHEHSFLAHSRCPHVEGICQC